MSRITEYVKLGLEIEGISDAKTEVLNDKKKQVNASNLNVVEKMFLNAFIDAKINYNIIKDHETEYFEEYNILVDTLDAFRNHFNAI